MATDPECGMQVDEREAEKKGLTTAVGGKKQYFCSRRCMNEFLQKQEHAGHAMTGHAGHAAHKAAAAPAPAQSYTCPMHPEIHSPRPGLCPICGMRLVPEEAPANVSIQTEHAEHRGHRDGEAAGEADKTAGFDKHAGHSTNVFRNKFWVSLVLTIAVVLYSDLVVGLGFTAPQFPGSQYLQLALGSIVFFYGGLVFIQGAYRELKARMPGMMTLIALAIITAYSYSVYAFFYATGMTLFWELTTLITIMLLGHWIEMLSVRGAQGALNELARLLPDKAEVIRGGKTEVIRLSELRVGDTVLVRPGGKIPADGTVTSGESDVNEALVTGESKPVGKKTGSAVIGGSINGDGSLKIRITGIGEHTFLAGVMRLVQEAQVSRSRIQLLADQAAFYLTVIAVVAGTITLVAWLIAGAGADFAVERLVAVLVVTCPHALGLAIPLVASISTTLAARNGVLVRERLALEAARKVDVVLFDKTGTLTSGEYGVTEVVPAGGLTEKEVLRLAASVDSRSEHFAARAIVAGAKKKGISIAEARGFQRIPGAGARASVNGRMVSVGGQAVLGRTMVPPATRLQAQKFSRRGETVVYVIAGGKLAGIIALADLVRSESREAVKQLKDLGVRVAMVTGDSEEVAAWVSKELGIDEHFSRVLPGLKAEKVKFLQARGLKVAMVGDGINDAPALTQADVGIAIGAGTNVAIESAGIILVRNDPRDIPKIIRLSKATYSKMVQNLFWATGYNVIAIPLAAGILYPSIVLGPAFSAVLMSLSTVIVAANAALLARFKP